MPESRIGTRVLIEKRIREKASCFFGFRDAKNGLISTFSIFCKIRAKDTRHAKEIIFDLDKITGIKRTETSISLEEVINDKKRLMHKIFKEISF